MATARTRGRNFTNPFLENIPVPVKQIIFPPEPKKPRVAKPRILPDPRSMRLCQNSASSRLLVRSNAQTPGYGSSRLKEDSAMNRRLVESAQTAYFRDTLDF
jgi:hypothetical protein